METRRLLSLLPCSLTTSIRLYNPNSPTIRNPNFPSVSIVICCSTTRRPRRSPFWDPNAESFRSEGSKFSFGDESVEDDDDDDFGFRRREKRKRRWWSEDNSTDFDEQDSGGILQEAIDSVWIIKVLRNFGWMLPAIILSILLATGPKAFLMALALPLGQSALSFAIDKVFGRTRDRPKPRSRTKKKPFSKAANFEMSEEEHKGRSRTSEGRQGYQSWAATDNGSVRKKDEQRGSSFGGWDELDKSRESKGPTRRTPQTTGGPPRPGMEKGKLSRRGRNKETPLFLRLLIAVFPFLGSWTKLL